MTATAPDVPVLNNYRTVVSAFIDFLTVCIHTIIFERDIYPQTSFLTARKYNCPVKQSRHPQVCRWIQDAVAAVQAEMLKCTLSSTSLIIHAPAPSSEPLERYVFSTAAFPVVTPSDTLTIFTTNPPPTMDLPEQFRATITRLSSLSTTLKPLPKDCSFTLMVELRDDAEVDPPLSSVTPWIAAEPGLQKHRNESREGDQGQQEGLERKHGRDRGGVRTTPVRSLESGAFAMEMWIEEGKGKVIENKAV
ncbi:MAG: hypothetical protein Q9167_004260 [Letrouitia subvulpina]